MIHKFLAVSTSSLMFVQLSCIVSRKSLLESNAPNVSEDASLPEQWPAPSENAPFPLLQNASATGVAQFTVLLPQRIKKRNITAKPADSKDTTAAKVTTAEVYRRYDLVSTPEPSPYVKEPPQETDSAKMQARTPWTLFKFRFSGLKTNTLYELEIDTEFGKDVRNFAIPDTQDNKIKFAYGSCMNDETPYIPAAAKFVSELEKNAPDFLMISGDAVYVDSWQRWEKEADKQAGRPTYNLRAKPALHDFELRYFETWQRLPFYRMKRLIPTLAVWDDHDFGINDGGKDFEFERISSEIHHLFYGAKDIKGVFSEPAAMGRASVFDSDGFRFILSDNRFARTHESKDGAEIWKLSDTDRTNYQKQLTEQEKARRRKRSDYTIFGSKQTSWIMSQLNSDKQHFSWLVMGNQAFGNHHKKESLSAFNTKDFLNFMADVLSTGKPFAILSGDIHASEVAKVRLEVQPENDKSRTRYFDVLEFAVSPFHSTIKSKNDLYGTPLSESSNGYRLRCAQGPRLKNTERASDQSDSQCVLEQVSGLVDTQKILDQGLGMTGHNFSVFESDNTAQKKVRFKLISLLQNAEILAEIQLPDSSKLVPTEILK